MKKGFTLSELLLSLGIIGVVAALAAPAIVKMMPDKTKTMYIKSYNTLVQTTEDILGDPELYYTPQGSSCIGLDCNSDYNTNSAIASLNIPSPNNKYAYVLSSKLKLSKSIESDISAGVASFTTSDGIRWEIKNMSSYYSMTIDLEGNDGSAIYSATNKKPTAFKFRVSIDGTVVPDDPLGKAYLMNSLDMHFSKEDQKKAEELYKAAKSSKE